MDRKEERKLLIQLRKRIKDKTSKSNYIFEKICALEVYKNAKTIAVYANMANEVETDNFIVQCLKDGKEICVPAIVDDGIIQFYSIKSLEELKIRNLHKYEIREPDIEIIKLKFYNQIDLFIVPMVGYDIMCNRLGYGGGYYDRYLANCKAHKIGVAFDMQMLEVINTEKTDVPMDAVVTEKKILYSLQNKKTLL